MKSVVLVNGVPASGKSRITEHLTRALIARDIAAVPFALDTVKEALFAQIGTGDRDHNRMLGRASYHGIFNTIAAFPDVLVPIVDAWHGFIPREVVQEHLSRAGIDRVVEIWCAVSPETAADRYRARATTRHDGHLPASYADELLNLTRRAGPLEIGSVIRLDTERALEPDAFNDVYEELTRVSGACPT